MKSTKLLVNIAKPAIEFFLDVGLTFVFRCRGLGPEPLASTFCMPLSDLLFYTLVILISLSQLLCCLWTETMGFFCVQLPHPGPCMDFFVSLSFSILCPFRSFVAGQAEMLLCGLTPLLFHMPPKASSPNSYSSLKRLPSHSLLFDVCYPCWHSPPLSSVTSLKDVGWGDLECLFSPAPSNMGLTLRCTDPVVKGCLISTTLQPQVMEELISCSINYASLGSLILSLEVPASALVHKGKGH